jgi:hypothetical protein
MSYFIFTTMIYYSIIKLQLRIGLYQQANESFITTLKQIVNVVDDFDVVMAMELKALISRGFAAMTNFDSVWKKEMVQVDTVSDSFVEISALITKKLYKKALEMINNKKKQGICDPFSGEEWWQMLEGLVLIQLDQSAQAWNVFVNVLNHPQQLKNFQVFAAICILTIVSIKQSPQQELSKECFVVKQNAIKLLKEYILIHETTTKDNSKQKITTTRRTTSNSNRMSPKLLCLAKQILHLNECRQDDDPTLDQSILDSLLEKLAEKQIPQEKALELGLKVLDNADHTQGEWLAAVSTCDQLAHVAFWNRLKQKNPINLTTHDDHKKKLTALSAMLELLMASKKSGDPSEKENKKHPMQEKEQEEKEEKEEKEETYQVVDEQGQKTVDRKKYRHPIVEESTGSRIYFHSTISWPQRLLREQPTSPFAYALAGGSLIKRYVFSNNVTKFSSNTSSNSNTGSDDDHQLLQTACRILQNGLQLLQLDPTKDTSSKWFLHFLMCHCLTLLDVDKETTKHHTTLSLEALERLKSSPSISTTRLLQLELIEARVYSFSNPQKSIHLYKNLLKKSSLTIPGFQETILKELGALYEAIGANQSAFFLWKQLEKYTQTNSTRLWVTIRLGLLSQDHP